MAVSGVSRRVVPPAFRAVPRTGPAASDEVGAVAPGLPTGGDPRHPRVPGEEAPVPYVNTRGQTTGRIINTKA